MMPGRRCKSGLVPFHRSLTNVIKLGGRTYFSLAVKSDGTIWAWGMNSSGKWATEPSIRSPAAGHLPVMVSNSQPGGAINNPLQVSCGYNSAWR